MANEEQLAILKQGPKFWNNWRDKNPYVRVDLRFAGLKKANLREVDLNRADLSGANLGKADLSFANLNGAHLCPADIGDFNARRADLEEANLSGANLEKADLRAANLYKAHLCQANLIGCIFSEAYLGETILGDSDLSEAVGLESVVHRGPSTIGVNTIFKSKGKIPEVFLRGCGLSDADIEYTKLSNPDLSNEEINKILYKIYDLRASQAIQVSPLFISYSHSDATFVDKLEGYLNRRGIRFWRDIHDATAGRLEKQIDRAMRLNPTVLLILSCNSISSDWVEHEVHAARELEKEMERDVLCPVALDDSWKNSPWPKPLMEQVRKYNILDFSAWKDDSNFRSMFRKLIDGLELFYKG